MKNAIKIALLALAAIVLVATVAVLAPRTSHAHTDSKTIAFSPTAARIPWVSTCVFNTLLDSYSTECTTPPTPGGFEVVIQTVIFNVSPIIITSSTSPPLTPAPVLGTTVTTVTSGTPAVWTDRPSAARTIAAGVPSFA